MSTSTGTLDSSIVYLPFGATRTGSVNTPKEFTGQRLDSTGLYYYNARYYDATIGRFISPDTVIQNFANPQNLNRYSYCLNNPLKYVDPSGYEHVYATDEGLNDDGEYWYCVYSDKAHNNLIAIVTGADNLASRYSDFDIENDRQSMTSQLNTPAYQTASAYSYVSGESIENVFYGGSDFGITINANNINSKNNRNTLLTYIAMGFILGAEFNEEGMASSDPVTPLGLGHSAGRSDALNAAEQAAMDEVMMNPLKDSTNLNVNLGDSRWPSSQGWGKYARNVNGIEIHFLYNPTMNAFDDFKFK